MTTLYILDFNHEDTVKIILKKIYLIYIIIIILCLLINTSK